MVFVTSFGCTRVLRLQVRRPKSYDFMHKILIGKVMGLNPSAGNILSPKTSVKTDFGCKTRKKTLMAQLLDYT